MRGVQSAGVRWLQAVGAKEGIIGRGEVEKSRSCSDIIQNKNDVKNGTGGLSENNNLGS